MPTEINVVVFVLQNGLIDCYATAKKTINGPCLCNNDDINIKVLSVTLILTVK